MESRQPDFRQPGTNRVLARDESGSSRGAALLTVIIGEGDAFVCQPVDIGSSVPHLSATIVANIPPANVIAPKYENVRRFCLSHFNLSCWRCGFRTSVQILFLQSPTVGITVSVA